MTPQREWFEKDYYGVLGVDARAAKKDIQKAYKALAKQYHPDANADDARAVERFKEVSAAYEVLRDDERRREYDEVRRMVASGMAGPGAGRPGWAPGNGPGPGDFGDFHFTYGGGAGDDDLADLLGNLFGGGTQGRGRAPRRGADLESDVTIPFEDAIEGVTTTLRLDGREVKVRIPKGVADGQRIRVAGRGEPGSPGAPAGDLFLRVHVGPHRIFGRRGADLTLDLPVTFAEATSGVAVAVPTLGEPVTVRIPAGTAGGKTLRVRGRGVTTGAGRTGDLLVTVRIVVPTELTEEQRAAVEALAAVFPDDPREHLPTAAEGALASGRRTEPSS